MDSDKCEVCGLPIPVESTQNPEIPPLPGVSDMCLIDHAPLTWWERLRRWFK